MISDAFPGKGASLLTIKVRSGGETRVMLSEADGRITFGDREGMIAITGTTGSAVIRYNNNVNIPSTARVHGAADHSVEHASAALLRAMKLSVAQLEIESNGVASARRPASTTSIRSSNHLDGCVTPVTDARMQAAMRAIAGVVAKAVASAADDTSFMGKSGMQLDDPTSKSEYGPEQHFPGSFPCRDEKLSGEIHNEGRTSSSECNKAFPQVHFGVVCDGCDRTVRGRRFKCLTCADYDLCYSCKLKGHHSLHTLECIRWPIYLTGSGCDVCDLCHKKLTKENSHQSLKYSDHRFCAACLSSSRRRHPHHFHHNLVTQARTEMERHASAASESAPGSQKERPVVHNNAMCDGCNKFIIGTRFKCGNCDDFDLCSNCEAITDHDQDHVFLKIRRPVELKSVGVLLPPLYALYALPGQEARMAQTKNSCVARSAQVDRNVCHNGTETVFLGKNDQDITTDQSPMDISETQTAPPLDIHNMMLEPPTPALQLRTSDARVSEHGPNMPQANSGATGSTGGRNASYVGKSRSEENACTSSSTVLVLVALGESENIPTSITARVDRNCEMNEVLDSSLVSPGHDSLLLHLSQAKGPLKFEDKSGSCGHIDVAEPRRTCLIDGSPSIAPAETEDEFVMVSPAELDDIAGHDSVTETGQAEPSNCEVYDGARISGPDSTSSPMTVRLAYDMLDAYDAGSPTPSWCSIASAASPRANGASTAANQHADADVRQMQLDHAEQLHHSDLDKNE